MTEPRILCCADLHLGRASAWMEGPPDLDRTAVGAWGRIVDAALAGTADAVAIAGDAFDGVAAYYETRLEFLKGLRRLKDAGIAVVAVAGNHDHEALPRFHRAYPDCGLTLLGLGGAWETVVHKGIAFVGWSFPSERVSMRAFDAYVPTGFNGPVVGLVHGDLDPKSLYHPVSPADLAAGADAWILGHIHLPQRVGPRAVYPGSPQALDFGPGEQGPHGAFWLTLPGGAAAFESLTLSTVRFEDRSLEVEVAEGDDPWEAAFQAAEAYADACRAEQPGLESVQLRIRAVLSGCGAVPALGTERSRNGRDAFAFTELRLRSRSSPWQDAGEQDLAGEVARLLLGAIALDGMAEGRPVDEAWIAMANDLVERSVVDVRLAFKTTVGAVQDVGDAARPVPEGDEARHVAREALIAELETMRAETLA